MSDSRLFADFAVNLQITTLQYVNALYLSKSNPNVANPTRVPRLTLKIDRLHLQKLLVFSTFLYNLTSHEMPLLFI